MEFCFSISCKALSSIPFPGSWTQTWAGAGVGGVSGWAPGFYTLLPNSNRHFSPAYLYTRGLLLWILLAHTVDFYRYQGQDF